MSAKAIPKARFRIGRIIVTPRVLEMFSQEDLLMGISRHQAGDWGELGAESHRANDQALVAGKQLVSAYHSVKGVRFCIVTEGDRSSTTVLLPEEA